MKYSRNSVWGNRDHKKARIFEACENFLFSKTNTDEFRIIKNIIVLVESIVCILVMAVLMSCILIFIQV